MEIFIQKEKMMIDTPPGVVPIVKDTGNERIRIRQKSLKIWLQTKKLEHFEFQENLGSF